jgi:hypothetical protein
LGIAALEDKIVQQAVVTILNQIYEVDFEGFSYGQGAVASPLIANVYLHYLFGLWADGGQPTSTPRRSVAS